MNRLLILIVISSASIASAGAQVVVPKLPKDSACKLLIDATRGITVKANAGYQRPESNRTSCEFTDSQDALKAQWRISFGFYPRDSVERAQKSWQMDFDTWKRNEASGPYSSVSVSRLHGYAVEDVFIVEIVSPKDPGSREAQVHWRKGIYEGTLKLRAPFSSNLADIEDAEDVFKAINWAAFPK